jgi:hypothetical protein
MIIGTDPSVRGAGFGQGLMHSRLDRCDDEHVPPYPIPKTVGGRE